MKEWQCIFLERGDVCGEGLGRASFTWICGPGSPLPALAENGLNKEAAGLGFLEFAEIQAPKLGSPVVPFFPFLVQESMLKATEPRKGVPL